MGGGGGGASAAWPADTRAMATTRPARQWGAERPIDLQRIGDSIATLAFDRVIWR
jgi:hypothetical protein